MPKGLKAYQLNKNFISIENCVIFPFFTKRNLVGCIISDPFIKFGNCNVKSWRALRSTSFLIANNSAGLARTSQCTATVTMAESYRALKIAIIGQFQLSFFNVN